MIEVGGDNDSTSGCDFG